MRDLLTRKPPRKRARHAPKLAERRLWWKGKRAYVRLAANGAQIERWLVPAPARKSRSLFLASVIESLGLLYDHRRALNEHVRKHDCVVMEAQPGLMERIPRTRGAKNRRFTPDEIRAEIDRVAGQHYQGRRSDFVASFCRVAGASMSRSQFSDGMMLSPKHHHEKRVPISLEELAKIAKVSTRCTSHALQVMRRIGWLPYVRVVRERRGRELRTACPSIRKLSWNAISGSFRETRLKWELMRASEKKRRETRERELQEQQRAERAEAAKRDEDKKRRASAMRAAADSRVRAAVDRAIDDAGKRGTHVEPSLARSFAALSSLERKALTDAIYDEHPDWSLQDILQEAQRRACGPPSVDGTPERETSDEP